MRTTAPALIAGLLVWLGPISAVGINWNGGGDNTSWEDGNNWVGGIAPTTSADVASIQIDNGGTNITTSGPITCKELETDGNFDEMIILGGSLTVEKFGFLSSNGTFDCNGHDLTVSEFGRISGLLDAHTAGDPSVSLGEFFIRGGGTYNATAGRTTLTQNQGAEATVIYTNGGRFIHNQGTVHLNAGSTGRGALFGLMTGSNAFYDLVWDFERGNIQSSIDVLHDLTVTQANDRLTFDPPGASTADIVMTLGDSNYAGGFIGPSSGEFAIFSADGYSLTIQGKTNTFPAKMGPPSGGLKWEIFIGADSQTPDELHLGAVRVSQTQPNDALDIRDDSVDVFIEDDVAFEVSGSAADPKRFELSIGNTLSVQDNNLTFGTNVSDFIIANGATTTVTTGTILLQGGVTWSNLGTFITAGSSTVFISNGSSSVYNNGQAFRNLTTAAGSGNTITLISNSISAINGLLHVVDGTCDIPGDNITKAKTGPGTFVKLGRFGTDITLGTNPQVDSGATLRAGLNLPPAGTVLKVR